MPPKASKGAAKQPASRGGGSKSGGGTTTADFLKTEDVLQAVLLADSFEVKLRPLTQQKPKVLLPLLNIPMLEYSLEFLVSGGVGELFVICCSHAAAIQSYLDSVETGSKWKRRKNFVIRVVVADPSSCLSFGDALRLIDGMGVINNDFVLISGDVISNVKLDAVVKEHKARVAQDKHNMMTLLFKQASHSHRTRSLNDDAVLAIDPSTQQLLVYDNDRRSRYVHLEKTLLTENARPIQLRYDLMDSHISICTPEVLMLFTDNFDWQTFHADFLTGVLGSEILGNKLFVHTMRRDEYAARCEDLRTYDAVSKDIIHRWTYPIVPDNNLLGGFHTTYKYQRGNIYREDNVSVSREARVGEDTVIGNGCSIGSKSTVSKSVIGRDCVIGQNVRIQGSYLWNNVTIEDGCVIDRAILADGVTVRRGTRIKKGVILSFNVIIGPNFTVKPYTKITTTLTDDADAGAAGDGSAAAASTPAACAAGEWDELEVGMGGVGRVYEGRCDEENEEDEEDAPAFGSKEEAESNEDGPRPGVFPFKQAELNSIAPNPAAVAAWLEKSTFDAESEDEWDEPEDILPEEAEEDPALANQLGAPSSSAQSNFHFHKFAHEVSETLRRGHDERLPVEDISLEMSGLKFSHNTNVEEFAHATFLALFAIINDTINQSKNAAAAAAAAAAVPSPAAASQTPLDPLKDKRVAQLLGTLLKTWSSILAKFANKLQDQVYMIAGLEQACLASGFVGPVSAAASQLPHPVLSPSTSSSSSDPAAALSSIYTPLFTPTLQLMNQHFSVFSEEAIAQWAREAEDAEGADYLLLKQSAQFRQWLEEAEEDEDDEEEEEDDE